MTETLGAAGREVQRPAVRPGYVVYAGQAVAPLSKGVIALPLPLLSGRSVIAPGGRPFAAPGAVWYSLGSVYEHSSTHATPTPDA